jgi:hypothetical protein
VPPAQGAGGTIDVGTVAGYALPGGTGDLLPEAPSSISALGPVSARGAGSGKGGAISLDSGKVGIGIPPISGPTPTVLLDASGPAGGGSIDISATGAIAIGSTVSLDASATDTGDGGRVKVVAGDALRVFGTLSARAGTSGGNGGFIETSGSHVDLAGLRVDASAPVGIAGTWLVDPFDLTISHGTAAGTLPTNPFDALSNSTVLDGTINATLNGGTSVKITTGTGTGGSGFITLNGDVDINYTVAKGALDFELDAYARIQTPLPGATIRSSGAGGPLNVTLNAGVNPDGTPTGLGGTITFRGNILTRGGNVAMNAGARPGNGSLWVDGGQIVTDGGSVTLNSGLPGAVAGSVLLSQGVLIDTRVGQSDANTGGSVQIAGGQVELQGARIASATGSVNILATSESTDSGVVITNGQTGSSNIATTSGDVVVQGVARREVRQGSSTFAAAHGVLINGGSTVTTGSGNIAVRGYNFNNDPTAPTVAGDSGVRMEAGAQLVTTGGGNIEVTGRSQNGGTGIALQAGGSPTAPGALPGIRSSGNVVLRAANDGSTDAIVIDAPVVAAGVINLRPGGVDSALNASDATTTPITLGGPSAKGFSISDAEFAQLSASTIVAGSNAHAADITVVAPLSLASALTLQNGGGGNIRLDGAVTATRLGLVSAGNITQAATAPITAGTLLARSTGGSVLLDTAPNNVSADTVGGGAAGAFRYVDVDTVKLGSVSVTGFDAAGNAPQLVSATSMAADTVFVRTLSGDLLLGTDVSSTSGTDLVAAARFQNLGTYTIAGAPWRVWADTWVGESRGGLRGSGPLPNLYHCAYLGLCTVTVTPGDNHFIYAQQPTATVVIGNASRFFGAPNPMFIYSITGLILGDAGAGFSGMMVSPALPGSRPGFYPINGSFTSAEGYAVNVVSGQLRVTPAMLPAADVLRELPTTYLYDRNIGPAPICLATGPLGGDQTLQGGDVLAREWSRVRSRPNLLSCVDTEKRNGCADF